MLFLPLHPVQTTFLPPSLEPGFCWVRNKSMNLEMILVELVYILAAILKAPFTALLKFFGPLGVTLLAFSVVVLILIHPWWLVALIGTGWTLVVRRLRALHRHQRENLALP